MYTFGLARNKSLVDSREKNLRWDTEARGEERARARGAGGLEAPPPSLLGGGHHTPPCPGVAAGLPTALRKCGRSQGRGVRPCGCGR